MEKRHQQLLRVFDQIDFFGMKIEFAGTTAVVYFGGWAYMHHAENPSSSDILGVSILHMAVYAIFTWIAFMFSGALFNPALTVMMMIFRRTALIPGSFYLIAQLTSSIVAASLLRTITPEAKVINYASFGYLGFPKTKLPLTETFMYEGIGSCLVAIAYYTSVVSKRAPKNSFGSVMGLAYGSMILFLGHLTGGACNPGRILGPMLVEQQYEALLPYLAGHIMGVTIGAILSESVLLLANDKHDWNSKNVGAEITEEAPVQIEINPALIDDDDRDFDDGIDGIRRIDQRNREELERRDREGRKKYFRNDSSDEEGGDKASKLAPKTTKAKYEEDGYVPDIYEKDDPVLRPNAGINVVRKNEGIQRVAQVTGLKNPTGSLKLDYKPDEKKDELKPEQKQDDKYLDPLMKQPVSNAPRKADEPPPVEELDDLPPLDEPDML